MSFLNFLYQRVYLRSLEKFSQRGIYYNWKAKLPSEHLLASIDPDGLKALLRYKEDTAHPQYRKYFNAPYWMRLNVKRALLLGLNRSKPLTVLDIGSGFGYFPYAAKFYGHRVIGVDLPNDTLFDMASNFLGVERQHHRIEPHEPLPEFGVKFDLVTSFQVCFNGHYDEQPWGVMKWDFFLKDLFAHHMNDGGRFYMEFNWSPHIQEWLPRAVRDLFTDKYGAKFDGPSRVTLFNPKK